MKNKRIYFLAQLSILVAIILLMSFTPLGYLKTPVMEITFIVIPVAIGAMYLGPLAGAILGGVFGLTSFVQAFSGALGTALLAISPFGLFVVCFVPRVLVGLITGLVAARMAKGTVLSYLVPSIVAPVSNTILFVGFMFAIFWNAPIIADMRGTQNIFAFFAAFVGFNAVIEAVACAILGTAIAKGLSRIRR